MKLRGGYYTPQLVAEWLCNWAVRSKTDRVLEPSSGDGVFLQATCKRLCAIGATTHQALLQVTGVEIANSEVAKSRARLRSLLGENPNGTIECGDFFAWMQKNAHRQFECVVGNPPFIRYQNFPEPARSLAMRLLADSGLKPNRLTNIWLPFVVGAATTLADGGRMALVLPAELLQVTYAAQLRTFLTSHFQRIHILACNHLFFDGAEQEVLLFLADGYTRNATGSLNCLIDLIEVDGMDEIVAMRTAAKPPRTCSVVNHSTEKWLKYFLDPVEIALMRSLRDSQQVASLEAFARVDVGVVTGRNQFFVLDKRTIAQWRLHDYVVPLIGRSSQLKGASISKGEWTRLADSGERVFLLMLGEDDRDSLPRPAREYVEWGEKHDAHVGYKCSIRDPWYTVPSVWVPDYFFFRQIYDFPRVVSNCAAATSTDTIHRMHCNGNRSSLITNLYTHLTAASAEIEGRSYGGGVLELEPNEAERLLVPAELQDGLPLAEVDRLVRQGRLHDVLRENDRLVLGKIGLSDKDCRTLERIWVKMRDRRRKRTRTKAN